MARARVAAVDEQGALSVDVDPDGVAQPWTVLVEQATDPDLGLASPGWEQLPEVHQTEGVGHTVTIDLPGGVYRVRVPAQGGVRGYVSEGVWLAQ
jgi:hypothetical protein